MTNTLSAVFLSRHERVAVPRVTALQPTKKKKRKSEIKKKLRTDVANGC